MYFKALSNSVSMKCESRCSLVRSHFGAVLSSNLFKKSKHSCSNCLLKDGSSYVMETKLVLNESGGNGETSLQFGCSLCRMNHTVVVFNDSTI